MSLKDMFLAANPDDGEQMLADARVRREAMKTEWQDALNIDHSALLTKISEDVEKGGEDK